MAEESNLQGHITSKGDARHTDRLTGPTLVQILQTAEKSALSDARVGAVYSRAASVDRL